MSDLQSRNAAIWFAPDGYDPKAKGINGRRVAGQSFLRGFLQHAQVPEFVALAQSRTSHEAFEALAQTYRPEVPVRRVTMGRMAKISPVGTMNFPGPNGASEVWRRAPHGQSAWSICGITHTTSTAAVMQGFFDLRMSPHADWDAVICTSRAVRASVLHQLDLIDEHIKRRFNALPPPRFQTPVIPLGIHCADFAPDLAAGAALRDRLGAEPGDVVLTTIARLTPHEKFDPLPIYIALQTAQAALPKGRRLHLALCGIFRDDYSRKVFETGAARLMPDVGFAVLDGASADDRMAALSGADVFLFLIDNIQETFGLAPIEAMAAGLPVLVSDWDGMKDTVTPEVGVRIPTRTLAPHHTITEALRYQGGADNYVQYCAAISSMTQIDVPVLTEKLVMLATNPDLRAKMGAAGKKRAAEVYDWSRVIPLMQDLWGDLAARRRRAAPAVVGRYEPAGLPVAPSPMALFGAYPTERLTFGAQRFAPAPTEGRADLQTLLSTRNYAGLQRMFESTASIAKVLAAVQLSADGTTAGDLASASGLAALTVERVLIWLLKYDLIRRL